VQHDEEIPLHREDDPFAKAAQRDDAPSFDCAHRRVD
jgi:hypothetical protein